MITGIDNSFLFRKRFVDMLDILRDGVILELVDPALLYAFHKSPPQILGTLPPADPPNVTVGVQVDLIPGVAISHPCRRHPGNNVVVVDPSAVVKLAKMDESLIADTGASKGLQLLRIGRYVRQRATTGANRRHGTAQ